MLYVLSSFLTLVHEYVYDEIKDDVVILDNVLDYPYHSKFKQWVRRFIIGRIHLPSKLLLPLLKCGDREKRALKNIHLQDRILIIDVYNSRVFKAFIESFAQENIVYVYFSNPLCKFFNSPQKMLDKLYEKRTICCSFDPCDAEKYDMRIAGQYFFLPTEENISVCDRNNRQAFFCGMEKDRSEAIAQIRSFLQMHRIQCDFHVPKHDSERINFKQGYLSKLCRAGILVDINQKGQAGLTRRPIEALLWNKKLVTDNKDIVNYDFYTPENIFVYGVDDPEGFEHFVETPLAEIPQNIKSRYTVAGWLEQFL